MEKNNFRADKSYSTYYWRMRFPVRNQLESRGMMEGYSKGQGDEAVDKTQLLQSKILMLYRSDKNYWDKMIDVTFYKKKDGDAFFNKQDCYCLFTMKPRDGFELGHYLMTDKNAHDRFRNSGMSRWLYDFYDSVVKKKDVQFLVPTKKPEDAFSKDDWLDTTKVSIKDMKHLHTYCDKLHSSGHNFTAVMNFYRKMEEKLNIAEYKASQDAIGKGRAQQLDEYSKQRSLPPNEVNQFNNSK